MSRKLVMRKLFNVSFFLWHLKCVNFEHVRYLKCVNFEHVR